MPVAADFQIFLNNYMTVVAGLFDQPFGDWYEDQSPMWVNRFVTAPLPFGVEPVVPPAELGVQLRGGMQFGAARSGCRLHGLGRKRPQLHLACPSAPADLKSDGDRVSQTNGKSIGARFRIYPLPVDTEWGRLELGASTYNGKWANGNWYNSWGVDFNYFVGNLQTRGEWLESYRQMPMGRHTDNRQGWYVQAGYFLTDGLKSRAFPRCQQLSASIRAAGALLGSQSARRFDRRHPGRHRCRAGRHAGRTGSRFRHQRVAGNLRAARARSGAGSRLLDRAVDRLAERIRHRIAARGGAFVSFGGARETPVGSVPNDHAFLSQFTIGF